MRYVIVISVFTGLISGTHVYLYRRLARDVSRTRRGRRIGATAIIGLALLMLLGAIGSRLLPDPYNTVLAFGAFGWMGMVVLTVPLLALTDIALFAVRKASAPMDPDRRLALSRGAAAIATLTATATAAAGVHTAMADPVLVNIKVPIKDLPDALHGFRIAQLTDIHVGATIRRPFTQHIVDRVNAEGVDLVAITGDLVDGSVANLGPHTAPLGTLKSTHGTYFCTGNHEYYSGVDAWCDELERIGIKVLRNARTQIQHKGAALDVLGVDDWRGGICDPEKAAEGRDASVTSVLLCHQPKAVHRAAKLGIDLMLSGHTHGGQIWPWGAFVGLIQPYVKGLHRHKESVWIYVSCGTGYWGPPMRVKIPAEITILELIKA